RGTRGGGATSTGLRGGTRPAALTPAERETPAVTDTAVRVPRGYAKRGRLRTDGPGLRPHSLRCVRAERKRLRAACVAAPIAKQAALELRPVIPGSHAQALVRAAKAHGLQSPAESSEIASPRTTDPDLGARLAETIHELREQLGVPALVKHVAADDDVETADVGRRRLPRQDDEIDRRNG